MVAASEPAIVPDAKPPIPFVQSHSRDSARAKSPVMSRPNASKSAAQHFFSAQAAGSWAAAVDGGTCGSFRFHPPPRAL